MTLPPGVRNFGLLPRETVRLLVCEKNSFYKFFGFLQDGGAGMGRNAKPPDLLVMDGKSHKTKAELEERRSSQVKNKYKTIKPDEQIMQDPRAMEEFKFLQKMYKDMEYVGMMDSHIISQYCMSVSELDDLTQEMLKIRKQLKETRNYKSSKKHDQLLNACVELDKEIRMKRQEIIRLADRLYLDPVARTKNVPKKEQKPKGNETDALFGDTG